MPSMDIYRKLMGDARTLGQKRKLNSDRIMERTWDGSIESRIAYLYDYYHDDEKTTLHNLNPEKNTRKTPIHIKYLQNSIQTYDKDVVTFHIQLKPYQECNVKYYNTMFRDRYNASFPVGLYIDIPDSDNVYNKWLVVGKADFNETQFPTFEILPCDKIIQYVMDGEKREISGVLRSQNSYNSGIWNDHNFTVVEDQQKLLLPLNRDTEKIYYNHRMIIDAPVLTEPRAWKVSKVNRLNSNGLTLITFAQDLFNPHKDFIEIDQKSGNVIGMWANYYKNTVEPQPQEDKPILNHGVIQVNSIKKEIKIGGSYKTLEMNCYDVYNKPLPATEFLWKFEIDNIEVSDDVIEIIDNSINPELNNNEIQIRFVADDEYINKNLTVICNEQNNKVTAKIELAIVSL